MTKQTSQTLYGLCIDDQTTEMSLTKLKKIFDSLINYVSDKFQLGVAWLIYICRTCTKQNMNEFFSFLFNNSSCRNSMLEYCLLSFMFFLFYFIFLNKNKCTNFNGVTLLLRVSFIHLLTIIKLTTLIRNIALGQILETK